MRIGKKSNEREIGAEYFNENVNERGNETDSLEVMANKENNNILDQTEKRRKNNGNLQDKLVEWLW